MDHSYSKERTKVQKIDHSYFTVGKKTPAVVLRKAQLQKQDACQTRTGVDQDHSYTRPDHSDASQAWTMDDAVEVNGIQTTESLTPLFPTDPEPSQIEDGPPVQEIPLDLCTRTSIPQSSLAWRSMPIVVHPDEIQPDEMHDRNESFDFEGDNDDSSHEAEELGNNSREIPAGNPGSSDDVVYDNTNYDLDEIDCLISDINLDHAYEVRTTVHVRRRIKDVRRGASDLSRHDSGEAPQPMDDGCDHLGDHTYLDIHSRARSNERANDSFTKERLVRFDDHTYLPSGRLKGASAQSTERIATDHTYLQQGDDAVMAVIRKAKSETNLTKNEQNKFEASYLGSRSNDHNYLNSAEGRTGQQSMSDSEEDGRISDDFDDTQEGRVCADRPWEGRSGVSHESTTTEGRYRTMCRNSWTGLNDHSYETNIYKHLVDS